MLKNYDIVIIGAGIVGLSLAREILLQHPHLTLLILEKESSLGQHASGRNSGILHSGIYYAKESLKAQFCAIGARELQHYCQQFQLPCIKTGKIILPLAKEDNAILQILHDRALANGARVFLLDEQQLHEIEPQARRGNALYTADTSVVDPCAILQQIRKEIVAMHATLLLDNEVHTINSQKRTLTTKNFTIAFSYLFNCAGVNADKVAMKAGVASEYAILPFKGSYYKLLPSFDINHQIYPVPDLNMPFLGIHVTKNIHNDLFLGPTASPVFGRHHYQGWQGLDAMEVPKIILRLLKMYWKNKQNFRHLVHQRALRNRKAQFLQAARQLIPAIEESHLQPSNKVGIRPQLIHTKSLEFVHDFVVLQAENSLHVLNAISPAFTSAFPFARYLLKMSMHEIVNAR